MYKTGNVRHLVLVGCALIGLTQLVFAGGTIKGKIHFEGNAPKLKVVKMDADPVCSAKHTEPVYTEAPAVINSNSTLKNVMITVATGLTGTDFSIPEEPAVLNQEGCVYTPHVFGVMAGQTLQILNSDPTLHNVHALPEVNPQFNMAMPKVVKRKTHVFEDPEDMFPIKCDVHPWMRSYVGVFTHPYFDVSDGSGEYEISNVPPGTYTIRAWQEKLPAQTQSVTVKEGEAATLDFTFTPPSRK